MSAVALPRVLTAQPLEAAAEIVFVGEADERAWRDQSGQHGPERGYLPLAPHRWLLLDPEAHALAEATEAGGHVVDVDGKWVVFACAGEEAQRGLTAAADIETVLERHGCAAIALFDCPAVLARFSDGFLICVQASYVASFTAAWTTASAVQAN